MIASALAAVFFGCIAYIGTQVGRAFCAGVTPAPDGPAPGKPPYIVLVVAAGLLGGCLIPIGLLLWRICQLQHPGYAPVRDAKTE